MGKGINTRHKNGMRQKRHKRHKRKLRGAQKLADTGKVLLDVTKPKITAKRARKLRIRARAVSGSRSDAWKGVTDGDVEMMVTAGLAQEKGAAAAVAGAGSGSGAGAGAGGGVATAAAKGSAATSGNTRGRSVTREPGTRGRTRTRSRRRSAAAKSGGDGDVAMA